jgi:hypothetical protein
VLEALASGRLQGTLTVVVAVLAALLALPTAGAAVFLLLVGARRLDSVE